MHRVDTLHSCCGIHSGQIATKVKWSQASLWPLQQATTRLSFASSFPPEATAQTAERHSSEQRWLLPLLDASVSQLSQILLAFYCSSTQPLGTFSSTHPPHTVSFPSTLSTLFSRLPGNTSTFSGLFTVNQTLEDSVVMEADCWGSPRSTVYPSQSMIRKQCE